MAPHDHHAHDHSRDECRRHLGSLSDYFDGTLSDELCRELEGHMASCENCRIVVNTFSKTIALYHQMPQPELPNAVKERLFKVLDLERYVKHETVDRDALSPDTQADAASG
jgi:anti-sigma factor RsiW